MAKSTFVACVNALITLGLISTEAGADSVAWSYSAGNAEIYNSNNASKSSSIAFAGMNGSPTGSSGIILYRVTSASTAFASPDTFANVPFDLQFQVTDTLAQTSKSAGAKVSDTIHFSGMFSATNVTKQSLLPGAPPWPAPLTTALVLGGDDVGWRTYSVTVSSFTAPGQPGGATGSIQAIVMIEPLDMPQGSGEPPAAFVSPTPTPEPGAILLAITGAAPLIVAIRRRKPTLCRAPASDGSQL